MREATEKPEETDLNILSVSFEPMTAGDLIKQLKKVPKDTPIKDAEGKDLRFFNYYPGSGKIELEP